MYKREKIYIRLVYKNEISLYSRLLYENEINLISRLLYNSSNNEVAGMYREILEKLVEWKDMADRKILLLAGRKGVGKTYTLKDFGDGCFDYTAVIDLKKQDYIRTFLEEKPNRDRFLNILEISCGGMKEGQTLIVLENAEVLSGAEDVIGFLSDEMKGFHVVLTLSVREREFMDSLGKSADLVRMMELYPLSIKEFLCILGNEELAEKIKNSGKKPLTKEDMELLDKYIKMYIFMGGMPSVVQKYIDTGSMQVAAKEKDRILENFENEINQIENKVLSDKVMKVWKSIAMQLDRENKKFQFGLVKLTARAREYNEAVEWLYSNKYIDKVYRVKEPVGGLSKHKDEKAYKVYLADTGLLTAMYGISYEELCEEKDLSALRCGAVVEQLVYQELCANENIREVYYWVSDATARIDFMFEDNGDIIPVEINLPDNTKAQSIKVYRSRYNPSMYITVSKDGMSMKDGAIKIPLYALWNL